jgi:hypothetical protein
VHKASGALYPDLQIFKGLSSNTSQLAKEYSRESGAVDRSALVQPPHQYLSLAIAPSEFRAIFDYREDNRQQGLQDSVYMYYYVLVYY